MEPTLKQINYDTFTVDFVEKDRSTHLHFYRTKKEEVLDEYVKKYFPFNIKDTGREIEKELIEFAPEIERLQYDKRTMLESRNWDDSFKHKTEREKQVEHEYKKLNSKYEDKTVIHKTITEKLLTGKLKEQVITYIIPEVNPFIDDLMLKLSDELNERLEKA